VLRAAREFLGIEPQDVVSALDAMGVRLTLEEYVEGEGETACIPASLWFVLCALMKVHPESLDYGYDTKIHLSSVRSAIAEGSYRLPVTEVLKSRMTT
jgi:hypothetical protein